VITILPYTHSIMRPMAGDYPQLAVEDVGRNDFLIASLAILLSDKCHQSVVNMGSLRHEEATSRTEFMEEKELMISAQFAMIPFSCLFLDCLPLLKLLRVRKGDSIDSLE